MIGLVGLILVGMGDVSSCIIHGEMRPGRRGPRLGRGRALSLIVLTCNAPNSLRLHADHSNRLHTITRILPFLPLVSGSVSKA